MSFLVALDRRNSKKKILKAYFILNKLRKKSKCFPFSGQSVLQNVTNEQNKCIKQFIACKGFIPSATYIAANCLTKAGPLEGALKSLRKALEDLSEVNNTVTGFINSDTSLEDKQKSTKQKRQTLIVSVTVINLVTRYQELIQGKQV